MKPRYLIVKIFISIIFLLLIQSLTYLFIGQKTLINNLLTGDFNKIKIKYADTGFVRDYYLSDCYVGDNNIYLTTDLKRNFKNLNKKLNVGKIYFDSSNNWADTSFKKYNVAYFTSTSRKDWKTLFGFFQARQLETLILNNHQSYNKEVTYQWFLFFWIPFDESFYLAN